MIKKIICFISGHDWKETRTPYGALDNGKIIYKRSFGDCLRCGSKNKWNKKND